MTNEHERLQDDLIALAFDTVDSHSRGRLERHLKGCPECSQRLTEYRAVADVLPDGLQLRNPPHDTAAMVLERLHTSPWRGVAAALRGWLPLPPQKPGWGAGLAFAAAVVLLVATMGILGGLRSHERDAQLARQVGQPTLPQPCTSGCGGTGNYEPQLLRAELQSTDSTTAGTGTATFLYQVSGSSVIHNSQQILVEVNVDAAPTTPLSLFIDGRNYGITHFSDREQIMYLDASKGDVVPPIHNGSTIQLKSSGHTLLAGVFHCPSVRCVA